MRCCGKSKWGYAAFIDCSDTKYAKKENSRNRRGCEFIYPTEQKMVFCYNRGGTASFEEAVKHEWLTESELKAFYETYRAAHPELYNYNQTAAFCRCFSSLTNYLQYDKINLQKSVTCAG